MGRLKIVFAGTPEFAVPFVQHLFEDVNFEVVGILTAPDRPVGRKQVLTAPAVKMWAQQHNIPVLQPEKLRGNTETLEQLQSFQADFLVVVAYGKILPQEILSSATIGATNVHPSLLPKHRGASPIQSAILEGDTETGVTIMQMDAELDHGPILAQQTIALNGTETAETLRIQSERVGSPLLVDTLKKLAHGEITPKEQDHNQATFCRTLTKEEARIDWAQSAQIISQKIRGYYPWPTAWTMLGDKRVKIFPPIQIINTKNGEPGSIRAIDEKVYITCGDGSLELSEIQIEGGSRMPAIEVVRGIINQYPNIILH